MYLKWAKTRFGDLRNNGLSAIKRIGFDVYGKVAKDLLLLIRDEYGTGIYERDWDVLLVIDGCRYDLFKEVASEYSYIESHEPVLSAGGSSKMWMRNNFSDSQREYVKNTIYITGNPFSADELTPEMFAELDEVWKYAWDDSELQTVKARPITDRVIEHGRTRTSEKIVAHFMQPHASFVPNPELSDYTDDYERSIWRAIMRKRIDKETVWEAYRDNLRYVLDDIGLLLENLEAEKVVITSDHGNAIGEWGFWGHNGAPTKAVREVPWAICNAEDFEEYSPEISPNNQDSVSSVNDRLAQLGYIEGKRGEK